MASNEITELAQVNKLLMPHETATLPGNSHFVLSVLLLNWAPLHEQDWICVPTLWGEAAAIRQSSYIQHHILRCQPRHIQGNIAAGSSPSNFQPYQLLSTSSGGQTTHQREVESLPPL